MVTEKSVAKRLSLGRTSQIIRAMSAVKQPKQDIGTAKSDAAKVVFLGDSGVGKTSLILRLCHNTFENNSVSTLGVAFSTKVIQRENGSSIKFQVWDTAGQEQYHSLASLYYRSADAAIIVFDVTRKESFKGVRTWIHELSQLGPPNVQLVIAANKTDLHAQRAVPEEEARAYAQSRNALYFETSAKANINVEAIFEAVSIQIHHNGGLIFRNAAAEAKEGAGSSDADVNFGADLGRINLQFQLSNDDDLSTGKRRRCCGA